MLKSRHLALLVAMSNSACDTHDNSTDRSAPNIDLTRFGIDDVEIDDGAFVLLDDDGEHRGRVEHTRDADGLSLTVELDGSLSSFAWAPEQIALQCGDEDVMTDACADALDIGANLLEAEGIDVPDYEPTLVGDADVFRLGCETVSTSAINCEVCRARAGWISSYPADGWSGGSCSQGWLYASCEHTFCSGGSGFEMLEQ